MKLELFSELQGRLKDIQSAVISDERLAVLKPFIDYIQMKLEKGEEISLNFICTHNSRRSQFSQIWAQTAADFYGIPAQCFSGGVEVTAFFKSAVDSLRRFGFEVESEGEVNPHFFLKYAKEAKPIVAFSKVFDDAYNPKTNFTAVMTCSHADENCPFIPGAERRIQLLYDDPKAFDGTPVESEKYDERSLQIASEMFYVFSKIKA